MPNGIPDNKTTPQHPPELRTGCGARTVPAAGDLVAADLIAVVTREEAADFFAEISLPIVPLCGVDIYKVAYLTTDEWGELITASGALTVPHDLTEPAPVLSYQHGTTTLRWDVASTAPAGGEQYRHVGALLFGTAGYVTLLPDYLGYGESGHRFHPYLHAQTLAGTVVDLLKSAKGFCTAKGISLSGKIFLAGYSEGGFATMAATKEIQERHPELRVTASAPMAGPYDLSGSLSEILKEESYPGAGYLAFAFWAYDKAYALDLLHHVIMPPYVAQLDALFDGSRTLVEDDAPVLPNEIAALFRREFLTDFLGDGFAILKAKIRENDLHSWQPAVPMRLIHSPGDDIVSFSNSLSALHHFTASTASTASTAEHLVQLTVPSTEGSHSECALPSLLEAKAWFDALK